MADEVNETTTAEITGNFEYNYSRIDNISGITIPEDGSTSDCKSIVELAAMAYNMSNKQTAYNKAAFEKYMSAINSIVEKYNKRISANEDDISGHETRVATLEELVGNIDLSSTVSLTEATQQLVKVLFGDDNYKDGLDDTGTGIVSSYNTRITALENEEKVKYTYSAGESDSTHKVTFTHTEKNDNLSNEDATNNQTEVYTATAVDTLIKNAKNDLSDNTTSIGESTTADKYIKGQVDTSGITISDLSEVTAENENHLMSEGAIADTLNNLINVLKNRETELKAMSEDLATFKSVLKLNDVGVIATVSGESTLYSLYFKRNSTWYSANSDTYGMTLTVSSSDTTTVNYTTYHKVAYNYKPCDTVNIQLSAYVPLITLDIDNSELDTGDLIPLETFYGGAIADYNTLTDSNNSYYKSSNVIYYCTSEGQSYITNGTTSPQVFAAKGETGEQGPQGIGIESLEGTLTEGSGSKSTYTVKLKDPSGGTTPESLSFTVQNGYGFRYVGTILSDNFKSQINSLTKDKPYPASVTIDSSTSNIWTNYENTATTVQDNDYVIATDDTGYKVYVFTGSAWQELIQGVTGPAGEDGNQIIPVYADNGSYLVQIGHTDSIINSTISTFTKSAEAYLKGSSTNIAVGSSYCTESAVYSGVTTTDSSDNATAVIFYIALQIDQETASVEVGKTVALTATVAPADETVTWTSSDTGIATVSDGVVTGVSAGEATITATADGKSATVVVTVTAASTDNGDSESTEDGSGSDSTGSTEESESEETN